MNISGIAAGRTPSPRWFQRVFAGLTLFQIFLYSAIAGGIILRIVFAAQHNPMQTLFSDPLRHWKSAINPMLAGPITAIDPVGFQIWLSAVAKLTFGDELAIAIYAGVMSLLTPWVWYRFAREALASKDLALAFFALLAWMPSWISIFGYFMNETLLLPLMGAALWATWRALRVNTTSAFVCAVTLWMLASMTRVIAFPAALICIAALVLSAKMRIRRAGLATGLVVLLCAPAAYRTYKLIGVAAPFGHLALNQIYWESGARRVETNIQTGELGWHFLFESPAMGQRPLAPLSDWHTGRTGSVKFRVDTGDGSRDWNSALYEHRPSIDRALHYWGENLIYLGFAESWPDSNRAFDMGNANYHTRWIWMPLLLPVLIFNFRYLRRYRTVALMPVLTIVLWMVCFFSPSPPEGRYRKPLEGLTLINAFWLLDQRRSRELRTTVPPKAP
jgi:hypothetical protein